MLLQYLKYQVKTRAFLAPIIFVFFTVYHFLIPGVDMSKMGLLFLQGLFYDVIRRNMINLTLIRVSNFPLPKLIMLQNLGNFIWFNLWFLLAQVIVIIWGNVSFIESFRYILKFEILLLMATIVGNIISNSDFVTIKSKFWQYTGAAFVFTSLYTLTYLFMRIAWKFTQSYLLFIVIIMVLTAVWYAGVQHEKRIKFFKYMIN